MRDNSATVPGMSLGEREDTSGRSVVGVIKADIFHLGFNHAHTQIALMLELDGELFGVDAAPEKAREIAATLVEMADDIEAKHA